MRRPRRISHICTPAAVATALLGALPISAHAGGFGLEQSAYYQGLSFAGAAAGGESLAAISWNPATASYAGNGLWAEFSSSVVLLSADVTVTNPETQPAPVGPAETNIGRNAVIGAGYYTFRLDDKTVLGLSMTSPFGLG